MNLLQQEADDVLAGVAYIKTLPGVDRDRIALTGHSLGGIVSIFAAGKAPTMFKAIVDQAGGAIEPNEFAPQWYQLSLSEMLRAGERISAPILIQHGEQDELVPLMLSIELHKGLTRTGKNVTLRTYPGPHSLFWPPDRLGVSWFDDMLEFISSHLAR